MDTDLALRVENLSKRYRLGMVGRTALHEDLGRLWARMRGRPDPTLRVDARASGDGATGESAGHMWALRDVSFDLPRGEVLGVIGRNGSGKSTLLKILSRVTAPTSGSVSFRGRMASLLEVGTGFHPELSGRENIFVNGAILGMTIREVKARFDEIVEFSGVSRHIDTPVKRYSSGMYVRLAFAVAAHLESDILLVDEVLAVGDFEFQRKCLGKMGEVARQGRTVLFVSHNMSAVAQLTTRAVLLDRGRLVYSGSSEEGIRRFIAGRRTASAPAGLQPVDDACCDQRVTLDPRIRFTELSVRPADGADDIPVGGAIALDFRFSTDKEWSGLRLSYTLVHDLSGPVCSGCSDAFAIAAAGVHTRRLLIRDLRLAPGDYSLNLALGQGALEETRYTFDIVVGYGHVTVAPVLPGKQPLVGWQPGWGAWVHDASTLEAAEPGPP